MDVQQLCYTAAVEANDLPDPQDAPRIAAIQFKAAATRLGHRLMAVRASVQVEQPLYIYRGQRPDGSALMVPAAPGHDRQGNEVPHTAQTTVRTDHLACARCGHWAISDGAVSYQGPLASLRRCQP